MSGANDPVRAEESNLYICFIILLIFINAVDKVTMIVLFYVALSYIGYTLLINNSEYLYM